MQNLPEYSKTQPQATALEEVILSACLIVKGAYLEASNILRPEMFYTTANQEIYEAMSHLDERMQPIDLLTVMEQLKKRGTLEKIGGPAYLAELSSKVTSSANVEFHAKIVAERFIKRQAIAGHTKLIEKAYRDETDAFDIISDSAMIATALSLSISISTRTQIGDSAMKVMAKIREGRKNGVTSNASAYTELEALDTLTTGMHPGDLIIVAARPAMGKTSFALQAGKKVAKNQKKAVAIFSLEMDDEQLAGSMICSEAEVDKNNVRSWGRLNDDGMLAMEVAAKEMGEWPIYIFDMPGATHIQIRAEVKKLNLELTKQGIELGLVIVDYIQLMGSDGKGGGRNFNREQEVSSYSRGLKMSAREDRVPYMALSQLSRAVETRGGDKRPQMSDLRESGAIEQDSDQVWFLYRPEYYKIMEDEQGNSLKGIAEIIVGKNRHGETGSVAVKFVIQHGIFKDLEDEWLDTIPNEHKEPKEKPEGINVTLEDNEDDLPF